MMQIMREKTQGFVAGAIAVVIALTFALFGIQNYLRTGSGTQVVAKVNSKKITQMQERIAYESLKRNEILRLGSKFSLDQKTQMQLKKDALQQLIKKEVITQAINKMGFELGQDQLWAAVRGLPYFQKDGHFSLDQFRLITERLFYSPQVFLDDFRLSFLQRQLVGGIVDSAFDLPNEIATAKKMFKQRRDFGYFIVSPERFSKTIQINNADVQAYYEQHQNEFIVPEKVSIQYIELSSDAFENKVNASEAQLKQYYKTHIASFTTPKKWQITRISLPLSQTADADAIEAARKKLSELKTENNLEKIDGVRLSKVWLTQNEAGPELTAQLDKLSIGQMTKPFRTRDGYSVGKILTIQPEITEPYQAVITKVRQASKRQQLSQLFSEANDKLVDLTYTNSDSLEPAAKELGLKIQTTDLITETGSQSGILANNKVRQAAFSEPILKHGYNSNPIEIGNGKLVVLRIKNHMPEVLQPLDEVRGVITEKLKIAAMKKKSYDFCQELLAALYKGKTVTDLVRQHNLVWQVITDADRFQTNKDAKLMEVAFSLDKPSPNDIAATIVDLTGSYAVLQLLKVCESQSQRETKKETEFIKSLSKILGQFDYQLMVNNLMSKAKIEINEDAENNL